MGDSLAGGLVPLASRAGSGTASSSSTLSGGLVPLGNKTRPTASFRRAASFDEERQDGGGSRGGQDASMEDTRVENRGAGNESDPDRKTRLSSSSSSRRRDKKEKAGDGLESSSRRHPSKSKSTSRRRKGSKDSSRDTFRDGPGIVSTNTIISTAAELRGGSRPSSGHSRSSVGGRFGGEADEEDDSYLFMGATAGAKGRKSAEKSGAETALDYDSTDSFGLPKVRTSKGRKPGVQSPTAARSEDIPGRTSDDVEGSNLISGASTTGGAAETSGPREQDEPLSSLARGRTQPQSSRRVGEGIDDAAPTITTSSVGASGHAIDLGEDFDSPDEMGARSETVASVAVSEGGATNSLRGDSREPRGRMLDMSSFPIPSAVASEENRSTPGWLNQEPPRRRSPSPPSSPRKDRSEDLPGYRTGTAFRPRPGRGLTYSESREDLKSDGSAPGRGGESDPKEWGTGALDGVPRDGVALVKKAEGTNNATPVAVAGRRPSMGTSRSLSRAASIGVEQNGDYLNKDDTSATAALDGVAAESIASTTLASKEIISEDPAGDREDTLDRTETRREMTTSGPGIKPKVGDRMPRRSALAKADKPKSKSREPRSRGVTFDDDLVGVDALDILPGSSSDDDEDRASGGEPLQSVAALSSAATVGTSSPAFPATPPSIFTTKQPADTLSVRDGSNGGGSGNGSMENSGKRGPSAPEPRDSEVASSPAKRRSSNPMTAGLSPAAARLMEENSSGEDNSNLPAAGGVKGDIGSRLGLEASDAESSARQGHLKPAAGATTSLLGIGSENGSRYEKGMETDDAKLELALGFTPSAMEGDRKPRRALPAGRRRRSRPGESPTRVENERPAADTNPGSFSSTGTSPPTDETLGIKARVPLPSDTVDCVASKETRGERQAKEDAGGAGGIRTNSVPDMSSAKSRGIGRLTGSLASAITPVQTSVTATAATSSVELSVKSSSPPVAKEETAKGTGLASVGSVDRGARHRTSSNSGNASNEVGAPSAAAAAAAAAASSEAQTRNDAKSVNVSVLASLERQLALLEREKESLVTRTAQNEERLQREFNLARDAAAAAQARAFGSEATLAEARVRIRQLEAEAAEHASRVAAVESRAVSDLRAEQESCLKRISEAATRHQDDLREAGTRHREVLSEVKRLHKEELEDTRKRNSDSKTLEALAGQVQASAGAVKLLQAEMMEKKNVSEVSREGQMDARERIIKELEHSARRAQQTAEEEVQRLQGTLMAMDQVMSALRGQNAGERERLRQEHLRMEALQGAMVAEVEAVRKSVEEERERLDQRSAALDNEKREAGAAARAESQRLAQQRVKLETERETFAALQVSATQAAEEMAQRHAEQEENLKLARQSLEREASALEARLSCARADLHKADDVRESLDRLRDQDELERRRLKALAAELERAFEEVQTRTDDTDERRREAEEVKMHALASAKAATKEREAAQLRSVQVEEAARRLEAERTSVAQARAQSATELSTSRRLKAELSRAFVAQQMHGAKGTPTAADVVLSGRGVPLGWHGRGGGSDGGRDMGAGSSVGFDRGGFSGGMLGATAPLVPLEANVAQAENANVNPDGRDALPFTGIAAAEATLRAVSCAPPFPGMGIGRELGRLSRRAADIREFTREQSAFLSSSRAARFGPAGQAPIISPDPTAAVGMGTIDQEAQPPDTFLEPSSCHANLGTLDVGATLGHQDAEGFGQQERGREIGGIGINGLGTGIHGVGEALGTSLSNTVLEELDKIEKACTQRSAGLAEAEIFVGTLGQEEGSVAV